MLSCLAAVAPVTRRLPHAMMHRSITLSLALLTVGAAAAPLPDDDYLPMPNGQWIHRECIHQYDDVFHVAFDESSRVSTVQFADDETPAVEHAPCPHAPRANSNASASYYSGWAAYAQTTHSAGFGAMNNTWTVPTKPTSRGPAPPLISSSVYFFNGLEVGHTVRVLAWRGASEFGVRTTKRVTIVHAAHLVVSSRRLIPSSYLVVSSRRLVSSSHLVVGPHRFTASPCHRVTASWRHHSTAPPLRRFLEDGGGVKGAASVILQPVLQYGKSGCLHVGKLDDWYFTS